MNDLLADIRYTLRSFRQAPAFFALVIGILAVGIGSSVSMFSLVDGILLRPLPYSGPKELVTVTSYAPKPSTFSNGSLSYHDFEQLRAHAHSFADLAITFRNGWSRMTLTGEEEPVPVQGAFTSPNLLTLFGVYPILGRTFTEEENRRSERVVVISEGLWRRRFGASREVLSKDLEIGHARWRVIGVMPASFAVPFLDTQIWAPIFSHPEWNHIEEQNPLERPFWDVMGRLRPGVSKATAQAEVDGIENGLKAALPDFHTNKLAVVSLREHFAGSVRKPMMVLWGAVLFLFLISCANVTNLLLARMTRRQDEFAIRVALGAGGKRVLQQLVTEALTLSGLCGALGTLLAYQFVPILKRLSPADTPLLASVEMDKRVLAFAIALSLAVGVTSALISALRSSRQELRGSFNASSRSTTENRAGRRLKSSLVVAEFAMAMVLLTGAALLIRSFVSLMKVDPGLSTAHILAIKMGLPVSETDRFYAELRERVAAVPGVRAVGAISNLFFLNETRTHALRQVEGQPPEPKWAWKPLVWAQIRGDYFRAVGIPLLRGRFFNERDRRGTPLVAIVNETLARRYWPGQDPLGKRLKGFDPRGKNDEWLTVVGIVKDARSGGLEKAPFSQIYEVQSQENEEIGNLVIRTEADPLSLAGTVRGMIRNISSEATITSISSMGQLLARQTLQRRFETWLIGVFSGLSLALAAIGVFAVMHYSVTARTNEIGIRMAVGAGKRDIVRLMLAGGTRLAVAGVAAGFLLSAWSSQALASMLFQVKPYDPVSFVLAGAVLLGVAVLASYLPARQAARIDPLTALRHN